MITHMMNDAANPPEALVWTMVCGEQVIAMDDGTLIPEMDIVRDDQPERADCVPCKEVAAGRALLASIKIALPESCPA